MPQELDDENVCQATATFWPGDVSLRDRHLLQTHWMSQELLWGSATKTTFTECSRRCSRFHRSCMMRTSAKLPLQLPSERVMWACETDTLFRRIGWAWSWTGRWRVMLKTEQFPQTVRIQHCKYECRTCKWCPQVNCQLLLSRKVHIYSNLEYRPTDSWSQPHTWYIS